MSCSLESVELFPFRDHMVKDLVLEVSVVGLFFIFRNLGSGLMLGCLCGEGWIVV